MNVTVPLGAAWSEVLLRNPNAVQIGLTVTPRQLRESKKQSKEDALITANNLKYFGEPVYEYNLIQAQEDGYLAACEIVKRKASIDGLTFTSDEVLKAKPIDAKTGLAVGEGHIKAQYTAKHFDSELHIPERVAAMCDDLFKQLCLHGGPEQKVIIFCTREIHADRVSMQMNNLYSQWCKQQSRTVKDHYAFKCMGTANGGREMIEPMRGSGERAFIACTVDLLATGVDIERLNAVVFFRYLEASCFIKWSGAAPASTKPPKNTNSGCTTTPASPTYSALISLPQTRQVKRKNPRAEVKTAGMIEMTETNRRSFKSPGKPSPSVRKAALSSPAAKVGM